MEGKSLGNTDINATKKNVLDVVVFGDGDMFKLLCKASSEAQGWMKSTKAMEIGGVGCVVQVTTQQKNADGSYAVAEAVTFVPDTVILERRNEDGVAVERLLTHKGLATQYPDFRTLDSWYVQEEMDKQK